MAGKYSEKTKQEALRRVANGEGITAVARSIGASDALIHYWRKQAAAKGMQTPTPPEPEPHIEPDHIEEEQPQDQDRPQTIDEALTRLEEVTAERDMALAILGHVELSFTPELLQVLLSAAKQVLGGEQEEHDE